MDYVRFALVAGSVLCLLWGFGSGGQVEHGRSSKIEGRHDVLGFLLSSIF